MRMYMRVRQKKSRICSGVSSASNPPTQRPLRASGRQAVRRHDESSDKRFRMALEGWRLDSSSGFSLVPTFALALSDVRPALTNEGD